MFCTLHVPLELRSASQANPPESTSGNSPPRVAGRTASSRAGTTLSGISFEDRYDGTAVRRYTASRLLLLRTRVRALRCVAGGS